MSQDDQTFGQFEGYSRAESIVIEYLVYVSAPLSVVGSALIIWVILHDRKKSLLKNSPYHRIMLGLSTVDFIVSLAMIVLGPWAVPEFIEYPFVGNRAKSWTPCTVGGFFNVSAQNRTTVTAYTTRTFHSMVLSSFLLVCGSISFRT